ncbi:hypothetical protein WDW89_22095 [Deltaproteobacteria bacterium TL4]
MKVEPKDPPRTFEAGFEIKRTISDCGSIQLASDEQVTFLTEEKNEYDFTRKNWGFYMAPSLNGRLASFHLRPVLTKNRVGRYFLLAVEAGKETLFEKYLEEEKMEIIHWMDSSESLAYLEKQLKFSRDS